MIGVTRAPYAEIKPGFRGRSHNLVIGGFNQFTQAAFGGLVAGEFNTINNEAASVSSGDNNTASGHIASVLGGTLNTAGGDHTVVLGGQNVTDNKDNSIAPQPPFL